MVRAARLQGAISRVAAGRQAPRVDDLWLLALGITAVFVIGGMLLDHYRPHGVTLEVERAREQVSKTTSSIEIERQSRETAVQQLRQQSKEEIGALQEQINQLRQKQTAVRR